jgi:hypothetical protein
MLSTCYIYQILAKLKSSQRIVKKSVHWQLSSTMRKDGWADMKKLIFTFRNFAITAKNIPREPSYRSLPLIV